MVSPPRWKALLDSALSKNPNSTIFQLATLQPSSPSLSPSPVIPSTHAQPRVRSHIFRSFVDSLPHNVHLPRHTVGRSELAAPSRNLVATALTEDAAGLSLSERVDSKGDISFPLLISTTDIRTAKVTQLLSSPYVELAWWIDGSANNDSTKQQFRISGIVSLVPSPQSEEVAAKTVFGSDGTDGSKESRGWWESKRLESFKSMSAHMKASWAKPTPGSPLSLHGGSDAPNTWPVKIEEPSPNDTPGEREKKQEVWDRALKNFALVVVEALEVDFVDLGVAPNRRWRFLWGGEGWEEEEVVA